MENTQRNTQQNTQHTNTHDIVADNVTSNVTDNVTGNVTDNATGNVTDLATARMARTPYHALGDGSSPRVPEWVDRRAVYRGEGRTTYIVETSKLSSARRDLRKLAHAGWDVQVERMGSRTGARIGFTQRDLVRAA